MRGSTLIEGGIRLPLKSRCIGRTRRSLLMREDPSCSVRELTDALGRILQMGWLSASDHLFCPAVFRLLFPIIAH